MELNGIFREEGPALFLSLISKLVQTYYLNIESKVLEKYKTKKDEHFFPIFAKCLKDVQSWCPKTKYEYLDNVLTTNPNLPQLYEQTYVATLLEFTKTSNVFYEQYNIPVFEDFFILLLIKFGDDPFVLKGDLFKTHDYFTCLLLNILRETFIECMQYITLKTPLTLNNLQIHDKIFQDKMKFLESSRQKSVSSSHHSDLKPKLKTPSILCHKSHGDKNKHKSTSSSSSSSSSSKSSTTKSHHSSKPPAITETVKNNDTLGIEGNLEKPLTEESMVIPITEDKVEENKKQEKILTKPQAKEKQQVPAMMMPYPMMIPMPVNYTQ